MALLCCYHQTARRLLICIILWSAISVQRSQAQPITAANDGTGTQVTQTGNEIDITGGTMAGSNQLHSFEQFNVQTDQTANFVSTPEVHNILGRVTGGDPSQIDGTIKVTNSNADLYLMNPSGVIFGKNAQLDVPGSFSATTATGIGTEGGGEFKATGQNDYSTLTGSPNSFNFDNLPEERGDVVNRGNLAVSQGKNINLVGGTVENTGNLSAPGGSVNIVAVPGDANRVRIEQAGMVLGLEVKNDSTPITATSLPRRLTGGNLDHATNLEVGADGVVRLTSHPPGTAVVAGTADHPVNLAGDRIRVIGQSTLINNAVIQATGLDPSQATVLLQGTQGNVSIVNTQVNLSDVAGIGGLLQIVGGGNVDLTHSQLNVQGNGGMVRVESGRPVSLVNPTGGSLTEALQAVATGNTTLTDSQITVVNAQGDRITGRVEVLGPGQVVVIASAIQGSEVYVGGDFQGKGTLTTAQDTFVDQQSIIQATGVPLTTWNGLGLPDVPLPSEALGGRVIVWADDRTRFFGRLHNPSGFAEVSGKNELDLGPGWADRIRVHELLLDPNDILISGIGGFSTITNPEDATDSGNVLRISDVNTFLNTVGSLIIQTSTGTGGSGDITLAPGTISWSSNNSLTLNADRNIGLLGDISNTGTGSVTLNASSGMILLGNNINLAGGNVTFNGPVMVFNPLSGANNVTVSTTGGNITFNSTLSAAHSYQYFSGIIDWTVAETNAAGTSINGLSGYLATIRSAYENNLINNTVAASAGLGLFKSAWIGANYFTGLGAWIWVTGPEAGTKFDATNVGTSAPIAGEFTSWAGGEPSSATETFLTTRGAGGWNDNPGFALFLDGYIVESGGTQALDLNAGTGTVTFGGGVGTPNSIFDSYSGGVAVTGLDFGSLTVTAGRVLINGGAVQTTGDQTYNAPVVLGANTTFAGNDVIFNGTLDSDGTARAVTVNTLTSLTNFATDPYNTRVTNIGNGAVDQGSVNFNGIAGNTSALSSLSMNSEGQLFVGANLSFSSGTSVSLGGINLTGDATISTGTGGDISLNGAVTGQTSAHNLTIAAGTGNVTLANTIGSGVALNNLTIAGQNITLSTSSSSLLANGAITLTGTNIAAAAGASIGTIATTGDITLTADTLALGGTVQTTGNLIIQPLTAGTTIGIGTGSTGTLNLDSTELANLVAGFSGITIGSLTAGNFDLTAFPFTDPVNLLSGSFSISGAINTGANDFSLNAASNILLNPGASITTTTGNITLQANLAGTATPNVSGIDVNGATIQSTSGNILLEAKAPSGGDGGYQGGIMVQAGGKVLNTSGTITLIGTGGNAAGTDIGVMIQGANSLVQSQDGAITITGTGSGGFNYIKDGIFIYDQAVVRSTGTANITLMGTGGVSEGIGVYLQSNALVESQGSGIISLTGIATGNTSGILLDSTATIRSTGSGNISLIGTASGVGLAGIANQNSSVIESTGTGTIALTGQGGLISYGVGAIGYGIINYNSAVIRSASGDITLIGTGTDTKMGIEVSSSGLVQSTATANITLNGTGGSGANARGIQILSSGQVLGVDGNINITGTGSGTSASDFGSTGVILSGGLVQTTGVGNVTLTGNGSSSGASGFGILLGSDVVQATGTGDLTLNGTGTGSLAGQDLVGGSLTLTKTGGTVDLNGNGSFSTITANAGNYDLVLNRSLTASGLVTLNNTGTISLGDATADIFSFNGGLTATGASTITVRGTISSTGNFSLNASQNIAFNGSTLTTTTGNITLAANTGGTATGNFVGLYLNNAILSSNSGLITLTGQGGNSGSFNSGIRLDNNALIQSVSGNIALTGTGGNSAGGNTNYGIWISNGSDITSTGTGAGAATITLNGTGGAGTAFSYGVIIRNTGAAPTPLSTLSSAEGAITIAGTAGGSSPTFGVFLAEAAQVLSTGTGASAAPIAITGIGNGIDPDIITSGGTTIGGATSGGAITFTANTITLGSALTLQGAGNLTFTPRSTTTTIGLGTGAAGTLSLDNTELSRISNGFNSIIFGRSDSTATVTIATGLTFSDPVTILGGSTLVGPNQATTWTVTGADIGTLSGMGELVTYNSIENLIGGTGVDNFTLAGGTLSGSIDGGAGIDVFTGDNVASSFIVTALNTFNATGITGSILNIESLTGGTLNDSFTLAGGTLDGAIDGGAGIDTLIADNVVNTFVVTALNGGTVTGVIGGFSNIENLTGGNTNDSFSLSGGTLDGAIDGGVGTDTFTADNVANTFVINAANGGTVTGVTNGFSNIENLIGGTATDSFALSGGGTLAGTIDGRAGSDTLIADNVASTFLITVLNGGTLNGITGGFSNIENLTGGTANDSFTLTGGTLDGAIDGGNGIDTLTANNVDNTFTLTGTNTGTATGLGNGFANIENLVSGTGNDTFNFNANTTLDGSINAGTGTGNFNLSAGVTVAGGIIGAGTLTFNGSDLDLSRFGDITSSGTIALATTGSITVGNLTTSGQPITMTGGGSITAGNLTTIGSTTGLVNLSSGNFITVGNILSGGPVTLTAPNTITAGNVTATGQALSFTSTLGAILAGDLNTSDTIGGDISLIASTAITTGSITTKGLSGKGGNVFIDPIGDVQVAFIDAQGGSNGVGGTVSVTAGQFFRAIGSFIDQNGVTASISTAGGLGGGAITINHGGGTLLVPFIIGDPTFNGTLAAITTGANTLTIGQQFLFSITQDISSLFTTDPTAFITGACPLTCSSDSSLTIPAFFTDGSSGYKVAVLVLENPAYRKGSSILSLQEFASLTGITIVENPEGNAFRSDLETEDSATRRQPSFLNNATRPSPTNPNNLTSTRQPAPTTGSTTGSTTTVLSNSYGSGGPANAFQSSGFNPSASTPSDLNDSLNSNSTNPATGTNGNNVTAGDNSKNNANQSGNNASGAGNNSEAIASTAGATAEAQAPNSSNPLENPWVLAGLIAAAVGASGAVAKVAAPGLVAKALSPLTKGLSAGTQGTATSGAQSTNLGNLQQQLFKFNIRTNSQMNMGQQKVGIQAPGPLTSGLNLGAKIHRGSNQVRVNAQGSLLKRPESDQA
jgi:filamentous hemagglutinin family protein